MPDTLADALPKEIARVREVLSDYEAIGAAGAFGAVFIRQDLRDAEEAVASGDVVAMATSYAKLRVIEP